MALALPIGGSSRSYRVLLVTATRSRQPLPPALPVQLPIASHQEISTSSYSFKSPFARLLPAYSHPKPFSEESNAPGVRCWRQRRRGGNSRVVADIAKLSVGREEYYTRSWPPTT